MLTEQHCSSWRDPSEVMDSSLQVLQKRKQGPKDPRNPLLQVQSASVQTSEPLQSMSSKALSNGDIMQATCVILNVLVPTFLKSM